MPEIGNVEASLESAFGIAPPAEKPAPTPAEQVAAEPLPEEPLDVAAPAEGEPVEQEAQAEEQAAPELSIDIEVDGVPETIVGADKIREFVQKGVKGGRLFEENARIRESLQAHVQQATMHMQFQQAVFADVSQIQALDSRLEEFNRVDWNAAFDSDPFNAMKLKEQREQLREQRNQKVQELNFKQQQFVAGQQQAQQQILAAESKALLAKLPEWNNSEKASTEQAAIKTWLSNAGFNQAEIGALVDHRHLLVARKAWLYDQLQAGKANAVKQVRTAPPVVKPGAAPAPQQSGKAEYAKFRQQLRAAGTKGQHKTQEALVLEKLNRAFKPS